VRLTQEECEPVLRRRALLGLAQIAESVLPSLQLSVVNEI
jgi:hypothetical protein